MAALPAVMNSDDADPRQTTRVHQPFRLLDLPPEPRMEIYDLPFASIAFTPTDKNVTDTTALMRTCQQIFNEASFSFLKYKIDLLKMLEERRKKDLRGIFSVEW
jgi:hypothetical protein